jgi:hypothetical protein
VLVALAAGFIGFRLEAHGLHQRIADAAAERISARPQYARALGDATALGEPRRGPGDAFDDVQLERLVACLLARGREEVDFARLVAAIQVWGGGRVSGVRGLGRGGMRGLRFAAGGRHLPRTHDKRHLTAPARSRRPFLGPLLPQDAAAADGVGAEQLGPGFAAALLHALGRSSAPASPAFAALLLDALEPALPEFEPAGLLALLRSLRQAGLRLEPGRVAALATVGHAGGGGGGGGKRKDKAAGAWRASDAVEALWLLSKLNGWGPTAGEGGSGGGSVPPEVERLFGVAEAALDAEVAAWQGPEQPRQQQQQQQQQQQEEEAGGQQADVGAGDTMAGSPPLPAAGELDPAAPARLLRLWQLTGRAAPPAALAAALRAAQRRLPDMGPDSAALLLAALAGLRLEPPPATLLGLAARQVAGPQRGGGGPSGWAWADGVAAYCRDVGLAAEAAALERAAAAAAAGAQQQQGSSGGGGGGV